MNEIKIIKLDFALVPEIEKDFFIRNVLNWYEDGAYDENHPVPRFENNMFNYIELTRQYFSDFLFDLQEYEYLKGHAPGYHHAEVFPIDVPEDLWEEHRDHCDQWRIDNYDVHELCLINDMQRVLHHHNMFYADRYEFNLGFPRLEKKTKYYNKPIKEVW